MATIKTIKRKSGANAFQILWYGPRGERRSLSLGSRYSRRGAEEVRALVERLVDVNATGEPLDRKTLRRLEDIPDDLRDRFAAVDLIEVEKRLTLGELWNEYWESEYYNLKPTSQSSKRQARRKFFAFFDANAIADELRKKDAAKFVAFLDGLGIKEATRAGTIRDVRRVFNWAIASELLDRNPFAGIARGSFRNKSREYFITRDDYRKLLDACPGRQWRVLLALYRIGGLRKEEALRATWADVDFPRGRLLVHSPKTERYAGREARVIPLFPELREELEAYWNEIPEGGPAYIITDNRTTLTKHVERIVFLAGLNRWERLFQNLRSSRAIEIFERFGSLAESEWIGHSERTAVEHYLHVRPETFEKAASEKTDPVEGTPETLEKRETVVA